RSGGSKSWPEPGLVCGRTPSPAGAASVAPRANAKSSMTCRAQQRFTASFNKRRSGLAVAVFGPLQNRVEVLAMAQRIEPRVAREGLEAEKPSIDHVRQKFDS